MADKTTRIRITPEAVAHARTGLSQLGTKMAHLGPLVSKTMTDSEAVETFIRLVVAHLGTNVDRIVPERDSVGQIGTSVAHLGTNVDRIVPERDSVGHEVYVEHPFKNGLPERLGVGRVITPETAPHPRVAGKKADMIVIDELEVGDEAAGEKSPEPEWDWRKEKKKKITFAEDREDEFVAAKPVSPAPPPDPAGPAVAPRVGGLAKHTQKMRERVASDELAKLRERFPNLSDEELKTKLDSAKRNFHRTVEIMQKSGEHVNAATMPRAYDGTLLEAIPKGQREEMERWTRCYCETAEELGLVWAPGDSIPDELRAEVNQRMK